MMTPDERKLRLHVEGAAFQEGVFEKRWDFVESEDLKWPNVLFWIAASPREKSPSRYYVRSNCEKYPIDPPTSTFWDIERKCVLESGSRPWGVGLVAVVFRTDWKGLEAFYHPYDRTGSRDGHTEWLKQHPYWVWDENHTIVDLLSVLHDLLNGNEYHGVREPK